MIQLSITISAIQPFFISEAEFFSRMFRNRLNDSFMFYRYSNDVNQEDVVSVYVQFIWIHRVLCKWHLMAYTGYYLNDYSKSVILTHRGRVTHICVSKLSYTVYFVELMARRLFGASVDGGGGDGGGSSSSSNSSSCTSNSSGSNSFISSMNT